MYKEIEPKNPLQLTFMRSSLLLALKAGHIDPTQAQEWLEDFFRRCEGYFGDPIRAEDKERIIHVITGVGAT